jgi:hypothetical protein
MPWTTTTTRATGFTVTAAVWNNELVNNMAFLEEVNYTEFTAAVGISATTVGTANQIVSAGAITFEAVPHLIEFWASRYTSAAAVSNIILRDSTTVLGTLLRFGSSEPTSPMYAAYRLTPTAASHTYNVAGWTESAATHTVQAGSGGTAGNSTTHMPGFIRIRRIPT